MDAKNRHRIYEGLVSHLYNAELKPGDTFIDIGANVGHHTWQMAAAVGETGRGLAVEPVPQLAARVRKVLSGKNMPWVEVFEKALSDEPGTADFFFRPSHIGWSSLFEEHVHPEDSDDDLERIVVEICKVDELLGGLVDDVAFIKLDIEHSEFRAMRGARELLLAKRPMLVFENSPRVAPRVSGYSNEEFFGFFDEINYTLFDIFMKPFGLEDLLGAKPRDLSTYYVALPNEHPSIADPAGHYKVEAAIESLSQPA